MELESHEYYGNYYGQVFKGWFIPPETTNYRFYMACDDQCTLKIDETPNSVTAATEIISLSGASGFRDFFTTRDGRVR